MIGGAPHIPIRRREVPDGSVTPLDTPFTRKFHKEHAKAMAATGQTTTPRPYPIAYTPVEGGKWCTPLAVKFSDGSIYDTRTKSWRAARPEPVDPVLRWDEVCAGEPLASNKMVLAGNQMVDEIRKLRAKLLDLEQERRENSLVRIIDEDDERDF